MEVAVKTLKANAPEADKVKFLQEAAIMGQFLHPNVLKLQGVVTIGEPVSGYNRLLIGCTVTNHDIARHLQPKFI